ncbi:hypothetical protein [Mycobacterium sp. URHB0021]|jgi:hypothetical protein
MSEVPISVAGAGLIGRRHIAELDAGESVGRVDRGPWAAGTELAQKYRVALYSSRAEMFTKDKPDGVSADGDASPEAGPSCST